MTLTQDLTQATQADADDPVVLEVKFSLDKMQIGDLALLDQMSEASKQRKEGKKNVQMPMAQFVAFLDRVTDGRASEIPLKHFEAVTRQLSTALSDYMTVDGSDPKA